MLRVHEELGFDVVFKGSDMEGTERWIRLEAALEKRGVKVVFCHTVTTSSTLIREKLLNY